MTSNKTAVITIHLGSAMNRMARMTIPTMKAYAEKINADFIVIDKIPETYHFLEYSAYWAKFILKDYLDEYSRIIYFDLDVIVSVHCPNLFDVVPQNQFGALVEDEYGNDMSQEIITAQADYGDIGWVKEYFNVGVMVISREHSSIFTLPESFETNTLFKEQSRINYNFIKSGCELYKLNYKFNHMHILKIEHGDRHNSYIFHYAAIPQLIREIMIEEDLRRISIGMPLIVESEMPMLMSEKLTLEQIQSIGYIALAKDADVFKVSQE